MYLLRNVKAVSTTLSDDDSSLAVKFNLTIGLDEENDPMQLFSKEDTDMPPVVSNNPSEEWGALLATGKENAEIYVNEKYNNPNEPPIL